jgi:organic hydroperoxide reductase OsmC/OhrA
VGRAPAFNPERPVATETFSVDLNHQGGYAFTAHYGAGGPPPLDVDELPPLGEGNGPNPSRLLATAVGHCLAASLLHCLRKQRIEPKGLTVTIEGDLDRNDRGRLRIGSLRVTLTPDVTEAEQARMRRCTELFEDFCVVTESVRQGIPVQVTVEPNVGEAVTCPSCQPGAGSSPPAAVA